jgi:dihydrofolate reductase
VPRIIAYIAASVDGYISQPNDNLDFLSIVEEAGEDYGYKKFMETIDRVIIGRRTYDWVIGKVGEFPHKDLETYVITRTKRPSDGKTTFYTGDLEELVKKLKQAGGRNIFVDGGAQVINELLKRDLIDEIIISIIPVLLGSGTRLFQDGRLQQALELISSKSFSKGLVQLHYQRMRPPGMKTTAWPA